MPSIFFIRGIYRVEFDALFYKSKGYLEVSQASRGNTCNVTVTSIGGYHPALQNTKDMYVCH